MGFIIKTEKKNQLEREGEGPTNVFDDYGKAIGNYIKLRRFLIRGSGIMSSRIINLLSRCYQKN